MADGAKDKMSEQTEFRPGQSVTVLQGNKSVQGVIVKKMIDGDYYMVELPDPISRGRMMPQRTAAWKIRASSPGSKDMMGTNKRIIRARGHEFLAEDEGNRTRISIKIDGAWEHATTVNSDNQTAAEWIEANAKPGDPSRWLPSSFSRPGAPDTFAVEDRFYFGKGRKER